MAKTFNGRKFSHGVAKLRQPTCPRCGRILVRFRGKLRCTEMSKSKKGNNSYRVIVHGSLDTIRNRMKRAA